MNGSSIIADSDVAEVSQHSPQTINQAGGDTGQTKPKRSLYILCIDDDPQVGKLLNDCLTHLGHRVMVASGGEEGIEMFRTATLKNQPYEVVVTDWGMPDIDGRDVARTIKAESPGTPIIMLTGWGATVRGDVTIASTVDAVVSKPPLMQELNDLLLRMATPA
ncbi:MAG: response regulator [Verrucomicrobiota bacterium]|jgi:DNA-binding response OmpR family regulator